MNTFSTNLVSKKYSEDDKKNGLIWDAKNSSAVAVAKVTVKVGMPDPTGIIKLYTRYPFCRDQIRDCS